MKVQRRVGTSVAGVVLGLTLAACGGPPELPPLDTLVLPKPGDSVEGSGNSATQSVCAEDFDASALTWWIDQINNGIEGQIAVLKMLHEQTAERADDSDAWVWQVEEGGFALTLMAEDVGDGWQYTATWSGPLLGDYTFFDGKVDQDGAGGGWSFYGLGGQKIIAVTFEIAGEDVHVTRENTLTQFEVDYRRVGATVTITFTAPSETARAGWDTASQEGYWEIDDERVGCWSYEAAAESFCAVEC